MGALWYQRIPRCYGARRGSSIDREVEGFRTIRQAEDESNPDRIKHD
jgi:hypothetical protein